MFGKKTKSQGTKYELVPSRPNLKNHVYNSNSLQEALLRALAAIATADGTVNLAEYDALNQIAGQSVRPALSAHIVYTHLENRIDPKVAFARLGDAAKAFPDLPQVLFDTALPILLLQGDKSKPLAQDLAKAINLKLTPHQISDLDHGASRTSLSTLLSRTARKVRDTKFLSTTDNCLRLTGDSELFRMVSGFLDGKIEQSDVQSRVSLLSAETARQLGQFEQRMLDAAALEHVAKKYIETADELYGQVAQRLALVAARIEQEKEMFNDSLEEVIHDAGNEFELEVTNRLKTDNWKASDAWKQIAKSTFAKELERRVNRLVQPHEKRLSLMKEDLRLFRQDMKIVNASILERQHHTYFAKLMPSMRVMTQVLNTSDNIATTTLATGTIITIASGAAVYGLGTAAVLPLIIPVAPYVGGAMLVAGIFKWFYDSDGRKGTEILHKREEFQNVLRDQFNEARESYFRQLDVVGDEFIESANELLKPVILEAEAASQLVHLQKRVTQRMLKEARKTLALISDQAEPTDLRMP
ncbi:hypothetical protein KOM00_19050 [Geomonas sp. Red69]|uniref:hypothetical protein n=1 Tax=Geomonas diazotrophica TaxID=2843197 RepID=UPI001C0FCFAE|nr:hypothetical protein [Geomonas diazotrophica]MBU5638826.1 hypothetical protein [Geomonas diazotrophica]